MSTLTGAEVWAATIADPKFQAEVPEGDVRREVIRPFIEAAPTALADFLEQPVTLKTLLESKVAFLRYCLDNGFAQKVADQVGGMSALMEPVIEATIEGLVEMLTTIPEVLKAEGVSEDAVLQGPRIALNPSNFERYRSGTLTVEDVLRTQPGVILQNT